MENKQKILFDGDCSFCNFWVRFITKRDNQNKFEFHSLQSKFGEEIKKKHNLITVDSIILVQDSKIYLKSTAALRIVRQLKFPWILVFGCVIIPKFIRDFGYDILAKNRRKFLKDSCEIHLK